MKHSSKTPGKGHLDAKGKSQPWEVRPVRDKVRNKPRPQSYMCAALSVT